MASSAKKATELSFNAMDYISIGTGFNLYGHTPVRQQSIDPVGACGALTDEDFLHKLRANRGKCGDRSTNRVEDGNVAAERPEPRRGELLKGEHCAPICVFFPRAAPVLYARKDSRRKIEFN